MRVTLVLGHTYPPSTKAPITKHERNRVDDLGFTSSLGVAERTYYAVERNVEQERRAAASPRHRRFGSSEPGVVSWRARAQGRGYRTAQRGWNRYHDGTTGPSQRTTLARRVNSYDVC